MRNPEVLREWSDGESGDLENEWGILTNNELVALFKESQIAQNYRRGEKVAHHAVCQEFTERYNSGSDDANSRGDFWVYMLNVDKYLNNDVSSKECGGGWWWGAERYDHTRSASSINPGDPDADNKFRGGKGNPNRAKGSKCAKMDSWHSRCSNCAGDIADLDQLGNSRGRVWCLLELSDDFGDQAWVGET